MYNRYIPNGASYTRVTVDGPEGPGTGTSQPKGQQRTGRSGGEGPHHTGRRPGPGGPAGFSLPSFLTGEGGSGGLGGLLKALKRPAEGPEAGGSGQRGPAAPAHRPAPAVGGRRPGAGHRPGAGAHPGPGGRQGERWGCGHIGRDHRARRRTKTGTARRVAAPCKKRRNWIMGRRGQAPAPGCRKSPRTFPTAGKNAVTFPPRSGGKVLAALAERLVVQGIQGI